MNDWLNRCHFGDCREIMKDWPAGVADACITDPPYGDTSLEWDKQVDGWIPAVARVLKPAASLWVFGSMRFLAPLFAQMDAAGFRYSQDIVWEKQNGTGFHADRFRRVHEHAVLFYRGDWRDVYHDPQVTLDAPLLRAWKDAGPLDWGGWMLRRATPLVPRKEINAVPSVPGIYALWIEDGGMGMAYVGKSISLASRLSTHWSNSRLRRSFWWDAFSYIRVPEYALRGIETAHIHALEPEFNDLYEPKNWPGHTAMVKALHEEWYED